MAFIFSKEKTIKTKNEKKNKLMLFETRAALCTTSLLALQMNQKLLNIGIRKSIRISAKTLFSITFTCSFIFIRSSSEHMLKHYVTPCTHQYLYSVLGLGFFFYHKSSSLARGSWSAPFLEHEQGSWGAVRIRTPRLARMFIDIAP